MPEDREDKEDSVEQVFIDSITQVQNCVVSGSYLTSFCLYARIESPDAKEGVTHINTYVSEGHCYDSLIGRLEMLKAAVIQNLSEDETRLDEKDLPVPLDFLSKFRIKKDNPDEAK